jgi:riboflavin synthase
MFTGIITGVGRIVAVRDLAGSLTDGTGRESGRDESSREPGPFGKQLTVEVPAGYLDDVGLGDSISLNGACMTVTALGADHNSFTVDVSAESLDKTTGLAQPGPINLEKALRANDRLGGHIVSGHVDGIGSVTHFSQVGESYELRVLAPKSLAKYLAYKGSLTVNGVSLTVNSINDTADGCEASINLIPHTVQNTALGSVRAGGHVNLEIDLIARYVERMLTAEAQQSKAQR